MKNYLFTLFVGALMLLGILVPVAASAATRTLTLGTSGADVTALQNTLSIKGYLTAAATGYFGAQTLASVKKFQCAQKIVCSGSSYGVVGPMTQAALAQGDTSISTGGTITGASLTGPFKGPLEFSGWIPDWRVASATLDVTPHLNQLTSVMPFGFTVNSDGTINDQANISQAPWPAFIAQAKADKVRVVPTIEWGDGAAIQNVLSDSTTRVALEDSIAQLVKTNNFDGIDIDFEAKQEVTRDYFSTFLKGLYSRMGNKWVYCTIEARQPLIDRYSPGATPPPDATNYANDYTQMNKYCDRVEIMAYDQGTIDVRLDAARAAPYAPVADPGWVSDLVTLAAQNIAKNKIIIGVPTYGYEYQVTPVNGAFQYNVLWAFNPLYATQIASQLGITPTRTSADEMGFIYNPSSLPTVAPTGNNSTPTQQAAPADSTVQNAAPASSPTGTVDTSKPFNYMTWEDSQAIADKVALAKQLGVRGVAVFSMGGAEDPNMWNVLK
ncbi:MAG TPA: glycosyl hydrolase family 18 protein [Candidatus Paceibacterota bacterium]|nr:glycosyl hydrolase family 18 protein [Candidatus Paceibacterota bacterium]